MSLPWLHQPGVQYETLVKSFLASLVFEVEIKPADFVCVLGKRDRRCTRRREKEGEEAEEEEEEEGGRTAAKPSP